MFYVKNGIHARRGDGRPIGKKRDGDGGRNIHQGVVGPNEGVLPFVNVRQRCQNTPVNFGNTVGSGAIEDISASFRRILRRSSHER